ncbi:MAG TPA: ankyrin repeat domain-containing protein, partial [Candidatus Babeliaceae bacterium]|nr:ankyrin repeat domain-containing protein [Candidatus Babeliaceae bacterium]
GSINSAGNFVIDRPVLAIYDEPLNSWHYIPKNCNYSPLDFAHFNNKKSDTFQRQSVIVKLLLYHNAQPTPLLDITQFSPFLQSCIINSNTELSNTTISGQPYWFNKLKRYLAGKRNSAYKIDATPLHWAAARGHLQAVQRLLELNVYPNDKDYDGHTPADMALLNGHTVVFEEIVKYGGSCSKQLLHSGIKQYQEKAISYSVSEKYSLVSETDSLGNTALHLAAMQYRTPFFKSLVKKLPNALQSLAVINKHKRTPLQLLFLNQTATDLQETQAELLFQALSVLQKAQDSLFSVIANIPELRYALAQSLLSVSLSNNNQPPYATGKTFTKLLKALRSTSSV